MMQTKSIYTLIGALVILNQILHLHHCIIASFGNDFSEYTMKIPSYSSFQHSILYPSCGTLYEQTLIHVGPQTQSSSSLLRYCAFGPLNSITLRINSSRRKK
jgi:hypothetical protein